ncbi:MAG TPA: cytochrome c oxidase subunit II [Candidatus Elarobacter sp.]|nr:cytochrome c oxidase subunit II [Candidatus Elarobacter sp.]
MHPPSWPALSSAQSQGLAEDWKVFTYAALAVAVLVWALIAYAGLRFRRTARNAEPRSQKENNVALEISWTVAPLILVIALFGFTYHIESDVEALAPNPDVQVAVDAFRWGWTFRYHGGPTVNGTADAPPEMVLPVGQTVAIALTSSDVAHAFWVPDMLFKRDAIPGRITSFDLTPTKVGTFLGRCGEFCGLQHAMMTFRVRVVSPADYRRWLAFEATQ